MCFRKPTCDNIAAAVGCAVAPVDHVSVCVVTKVEYFRRQRHGRAFYTFDTVDHERGSGVLDGDDRVVRGAHKRCIQQRIRHRQ